MPKQAASVIDFKSLDMENSWQFTDALTKEKLNLKGKCLYDVEALTEPVIRNGILMRKVHFVRYSEEYNKWTPVSDIISKTEQEIASFLPVVLAQINGLKLAIKVNLKLTRRAMTSVDIEESISHETWCALSPFLRPIKVY